MRQSLKKGKNGELNLQIFIISPLAKFFPLTEVVHYLIANLCFSNYLSGNHT